MVDIDWHLTMAMEQLRAAVGIRRTGVLLTRDQAAAILEALNRHNQHPSAAGTLAEVTAERDRFRAAFDREDLARRAAEDELRALRGTVDAAGRRYSYRAVGSVLAADALAAEGWRLHSAVPCGDQISYVMERPASARPACEGCQEVGA